MKGCSFPEKNNASQRASIIFRLDFLVDRKEFISVYYDHNKCTRLNIIQEEIEYAHLDNRSVLEYETYCLFHVCLCSMIDCNSFLSKKIISFEKICGASMLTRFLNVAETETMMP